MKFPDILKSPSLTPLYVILVAIAFIVAFIVVGRYSDTQVHDYGVGVVDTHTNPAVGSGFEGIQHALIRWDSNHYVNIVEGGYTEDNVAFFPLYPIIASFFHSLGLSAPTALLLVSYVFTILSAVVFFYWIRFELKQRKSKVSPWTALLLLAVFPTSFFFAAAYSESVSFFFVLSSLYAYRTKHYLLSGILLAIATGSRLQAGALAVFFLLDYLFQKKWSDWKKLIPVVLAPLGLAAYMLYQYVIFGNPLLFVTVQEKWGRLSGNVIENLLSSVTPMHAWYIPVILVALYAIHKYLGKVWFIYTLIFLLIPLVSGRLDSLNRYILVLPPFILGLALLFEQLPSWVIRTFLISASFLLAWNIILFTNNYWVG